MNVVHGIVNAAELVSDSIKLKWCEAGFVVAAGGVTVFLKEVRSYITQKVCSNTSGNWKQYPGVSGCKNK